MRILNRIRRITLKALFSCIWYKNSLGTVIEPVSCKDKSTTEQTFTHEDKAVFPSSRRNHLRNN